jgi:hypothetical protein
MTTLSHASPTLDAGIAARGRIAGLSHARPGSGETLQRRTKIVATLLDGALGVARDFAGLRSGDRVVVTSGEQPGASGATNVIIERALA